jgi:methylmalonyl-CoA mutase, N-terminal domain
VDSMRNWFVMTSAAANEHSTSRVARRAVDIRAWWCSGRNATTINMGIRAVRGEGSAEELAGVFPFTRGATTVGPDTDRWFATYYSGAGTAPDTNQLFKDRFAMGVTQLVLAMDLPTQVGIDPDDELAAGEVGRVGVAVSSIDDMAAVFHGLDLELLSTGTVGNAIGIYTAPLFELAGKMQGVDGKQMHVSLQNDPLKEFTGRGAYIFPIEIALELSIDVVEYCHRYLGKNWKPQYTCATQMRWGGVSAAQEIGFGLASMMTYLDRACRRRIDPSQYLARTDFHMSADNDLLEEIAKFRAARRLWAQLISDRYGRTIAESSPLTITVFTAGNRLTAQRPLNNIVRTTVHAMAAMLGGVNEMVLPGYDEALGLPSREAAALTNATKQILYYESGIGRVVDAIGGSYELERLTTLLCDEGRYWFDTVQDQGGMVTAIESGFVRSTMAEALHGTQLEIDGGARKVVGLNFGDVSATSPPKLFRGNPDAERDQIERVKSLRQRRPSAPTSRSLATLREAAIRKAREPERNLVPEVSACIESMSTVGEIFGVLRDIFGEYVPTDRSVPTARRGSDAN